SAKLPARYREVAWARCADGHAHRVKTSAKLLHAHVVADIHPHAELHSLGNELLEPPIEDSFLELELQNAITKETADAIGALEDDDRVARTAKLLRRRKPRRPRSYDGHPSPRLPPWRTRNDPPLAKRAIDDALLDVANRNRLVDQREHARRL